MTTIKLKNGSGAPLAGDLVVGEPALDLTNKRLYTEDSGGTVIEVGTNPGEDVTFADNRKAIFGAGSDLQIYHDGTHSRVDDTGTGKLILRGNDAVEIHKYTGEYMITAAADGAVTLYHDDLAKLATTATGIDVTGTVTADGLTVSGDSTIGGSSATANVLLDLVEPTSTSDIILGLSANGSGRTQLRTTQGLGTSSDFRLLTVDSGSTRERFKIANNGDISFYEDTGTTAKFFWDASAESLGIGTSSPAAPLSVEGSGGLVANFNDTNVNGGYVRFQNSGTSIGDIGAGAQVLSGGTAGDFGITSRSGNLVFGTGTAERMRLNTFGDLLVGTTDSIAGVNGGGLPGIALSNEFNALFITRDGGAPAVLNRETSDGDIAVFRKNGATVGSIGAFLSSLYIGTGDVGLFTQAAYDRILPFNPSAQSGRDNAIDLGESGTRFDDIYATNGTIQTSDRNEKQDIEALSDAEQRVAVAAKGLLRKFRWIDSVEEKGDDARIHFGIIAQDLQDAFTAEGLDAGRYAMFISTTWWESTEVIPAVEAQEAVVDEEGNVVEEAVEAQEERTVVHTYDTAEEAPEGSVERTRLGVRYPQLLAFIIAAI